MPKHARIEPYWVADERAAKAARLADHLRTVGLSPAAVVRLDTASRRAVEKAALVNRGSGQTWRQAVEMLVGSRRARAACPGCKVGDPRGVAGPPRPHGHEGPCARG